MPYQFPHFSNTSQLDGPDLAPPQQRLSKQIVAYWSAFARTGNPGAAGGPQWRAFSEGGKALRLKPGEVGMFDASQAHQCALWEKLYPEQLGR
jgi:para-nitrobenzyl esterase